MGTLTAQFYSNLVQKYNVVFLTKLRIFVKIDLEMTSQRRHYHFGGLDLPQVPLQESVAVATAKDLHSNVYLFDNFVYIFRKSHQIWLNYLSPSLSYGQKTLRVVPNTPRAAGQGQVLS